LAAMPAASAAVTPVAAEVAEAEEPKKGNRFISNTEPHIIIL